MNTAFKLILCVFLCVAFLAGGIARSQEKEIPEALKPWEGWATWGDKHLDCPTPYHNADKHICFWPSRLTLSANQNEGTWSAGMTVFEETWIPLPGSSKIWPSNVRANGEVIPVIERNGSPFVQLPAGLHQLSGDFRWEQMPQRIAIPRQVGILSLAMEGTAVPIPNWDAKGNVWLKRIRGEVADKDLLAVQIYRVVEDGIPLWLRTEIELSVSGKSREEQLGWILPQGWKLSLVDSPLPTAIDDSGRMKAQVRAGKWTIRVDAFRATDAGEIRFATDAQPAVLRELIAFRANPNFRMAEFEGIQAVDATQTTFPGKWRNLPVFAWQTDTSFRLVEKIRGMGLQQPKGLAISRKFWLDEDGRGLTYHDTVRGQMQRLWRLDVAEGHELGSIRVDGKGQLITSNPQTGEHGVEIRTRNLNLEAVGRIERTSDLPATGWQSSADSLGVTLMLPPGWRVFALFGADQVDGDWLTAWTLLDLFLLLIFSLAVFRLWGFKAGVVAFLAFGLAYHEPSSPRLTWFFLLIPVALLRVAPEGAGKHWLTRWKYLSAALLALVLVPFIAQQIQSAIYPQLEARGTNYAARGMFQQSHRQAGRSPRIDHFEEGSHRELINDAYSEQRSKPKATSMRQNSFESMGRRLGGGGGGFGKSAKARFQTSNLLYDPQARIQTGPAEPEWAWNQVHCTWNGPVSAEQQIKPVLISLSVHRGVTVVRLSLLLLLAAILCGVRRTSRPIAKQTVAAAVVLMTMFGASPSYAQFPDQKMLDTLRARLLEPSDAYPHAAEISAATLQIRGNRISLEAEIHAAIRVAVPLPGRLQAWSPVSVSMEGESDVLLNRHDGYLWLVVPPGVHRVTVEGLLPEATEWEWSFLLKPHRVSIDAPDWNITGVRRNGVPEAQVFFARRRQAAVGEASYDRRDFHAVMAVDRHLEIGLVWQVHNVVTRLSSAGKAVSMMVPLLPGERVLTSNIEVRDGLVEVRLGSGQKKFAWKSELPVGKPIELDAAQTDQWVERWHLVTSPVWNVAQPGLSPVFEPQQQNLVPVWHPWPGESMTLAFSKPLAVVGEIVTVQHANHYVSLGSRQRTTQLKLDIQCSLGNDFAILLNPEAEISSLKLGGQSIPVRRDGNQLIIPLRPGKQSVEVAWRTDEAMQTVVGAGQVQLPVEGANVTTVIRTPENRWVLWAAGPLRGPAVRFWSILACAVLAALVLGSLPQSPLGRVEWVLLALGLTQVHVAAALIVVGWFFVLTWRGKQKPDEMRPWRFDLLQVQLALLTMGILVILVVVVGEGLLGNPEMFIVGNNSSQHVLQWFQPRGAVQLPEPYIVSVSVWFYRLLMLFWALWLAAALLRWLKWAWTQFSSGGGWKRLFGRRGEEKVAGTN